MRVRVAASVVLFLSVALLSAPWLQSEAEIPHFNDAPPAKGETLPPILTKDQLWGAEELRPFQIHAYELAAKIPKILYQQPCYCFCDRSMSHNSLHSCFAGTHALECGTCLKELYYTYAMYKQHKTARQIREGIIAGEWKTVDLQKSATLE